MRRRHGRFQRRGAKFAVNSEPTTLQSDRQKDGAMLFTKDQLSMIDNIVVKARRQAGARLDALHAQLSELLLAVRIADDRTEDAKNWRKFADDEDHKEKARLFHKIATSGRPLKPTLYIDNMMAELRSELREPRKSSDPIIVPSYRTHLVRSLAEHSVTEIQRAARHLAIFHQSQVRRGQPIKRDLDTALDQLADIYAIATCYRKHRHSLTLSDRSLFGKFCRAVLEPHCEASECSFSALSGRWERFKEHASRPAKRVTRAPKRVLRSRKKQDLTAS